MQWIKERCMESLAWFVLFCLLVLIQSALSSSNRITPNCSFDEYHFCDYVASNFYFDNKGVCVRSKKLGTLSLSLSPQSGQLFTRLCLRVHVRPRFQESHDYAEIASVSDYEQSLQLNVSLEGVGQWQLPLGLSSTSWHRYWVSFVFHNNESHLLNFAARALCLDNITTSAMDLCDKAQRHPRYVGRGGSGFWGVLLRFVLAAPHHGLLLFGGLLFLVLVLVLTCSFWRTRQYTTRRQLFTCHSNRSSFMVRSNGRAGISSLCARRRYSSAPSLVTDQQQQQHHHSRFLAFEDVHELDSDEPLPMIASRCTTAVAAVRVRRRDLLKRLSSDPGVGSATTAAALLPCLDELPENVAPARSGPARLPPDCFVLSRERHSLLLMSSSSRPDAAVVDLASETAGQVLGTGTESDCTSAAVNSLPTSTECQELPRYEEAVRMLVMAAADCSSVASELDKKNPLD